MTMRDIGRTLDDGHDASLVSGTSSTRRTCEPSGAATWNTTPQRLEARAARTRADTAESANSTEIENGAGAVTRG